MCWGIMIVGFPQSQMIQWGTPWDGRLGDVYDFMRFYSISLIDFSLSMISPFLDKRLTAD